jgi:hypothetical protein
LITEIKRFIAHCKFLFSYDNIDSNYFNRSPRACVEVINDLLAKWNKLSCNDYKTVTWTSYDRKGNVIYHTDCMMTLLNDHAVVCVTAIKNKKERKKVILELCNPPQNIIPYKILELDRNEVEGMCANMFNLVDRSGKNTIIMSDRARRAYDEDKF